MRRRDFVQRLPMVATSVLVGASTVSLGACAGAAYVTPRTLAPGRLAIDAGALTASNEVFVQAPGMERPIYVRRLATGETVALLAACTHQGCQPEPVGDRLVCPCHGSEFSFLGEVLQGPAERPLTRYPVVGDGDDLVIRLDGGS